MSDKISAFIVVFENDMSEEKAERMQKALRFFSGVVDVQPYVSGQDLGGEITARMRTDSKWRNAIFELLDNTNKPFI